MDKETRIMVLKENRKDLKEIRETLKKAMDYIGLQRVKGKEELELLSDLVRGSGKAIKLDGRFGKELRDLEV
jgi:hypothetical protein